MGDDAMVSPIDHYHRSSHLHTSCAKRRSRTDGSSGATTAPVLPSIPTPLWDLCLASGERAGKAHQSLGGRSKRSQNRP